MELEPHQTVLRPSLPHPPASGERRGAFTLPSHDSPDGKRGDVQFGSLSSMKIKRASQFHGEMNIVSKVNLLSLFQMKGITIRPLVKYLDVKKTNKKESVNEEIHIRVSFKFILKFIILIECQRTICPWSILSGSRFPES